jgi:hypothetical protein
VGPQAPLVQHLLLVGRDGHLRRRQSRDRKRVSQIAGAAGQAPHRSSSAKRRSAQSVPESAAQRGVAMRRRLAPFPVPNSSRRGKTHSPRLHGQLAGEGVPQHASLQRQRLGLRAQRGDP